MLQCSNSESFQKHNINQGMMQVKHSLKSL